MAFPLDWLIEKSKGRLPDGQFGTAPAGNQSLHPNGERWNGDGSGGNGNISKRLADTPGTCRVELSAGQNNVIIRTDGTVAARQPTIGEISISTSSMTATRRHEEDTNSIVFPR